MVAATVVVVMVVVAVVVVQRGGGVAAVVAGVRKQPPKVLFVQVAGTVGKRRPGTRRGVVGGRMERSKPNEEMLVGEV